MIKNLLLFFCFILCSSASAQTVLSLDTAPLGEAKTVILPTYNNLLKLRMADSAQFIAAMKYYGYEQIKGLHGSYCTIDEDDYYVSMDDKYSTSVFFGVNTPYPQALEDDIKKRFPDAKHETIGSSEFYTITINDAGGRHFQTVNIDKKGIGTDKAGGSGQLTIVK